MDDARPYENLENQPATWNIATDMAINEQMQIQTRKVSCIHCGTIVGKHGLRGHQQSQSCKATQSRKSIPDEMVMMLYELRSQIYTLTAHWSSFDNMPMIKTYVVGYRRPGWGKNGRNVTQIYIHHKLARVLASDLPKDEKLVCLYRDADSPEFNAAYAMAELAG
jgi:hypothetical protein